MLRGFNCLRKALHHQPALRYCSSVGSGVPYRGITDSEVSSESSVPSDVDVVVIGGGAIGCSTLYHLAKLGVTNTVLVERSQLTSGTTWHTAGLVWHLRPSDTEVQLLTYSRKLMESLEEETGVDPGWINNGGLFIASSKERMDEYRRLHTIGKAFGVESHVLGPEETLKLYPLMNVKDVYATLYSPRDGTIDPAGLCTALTRSATRAGAKLVTDCRVEGIETGTDDMGLRRVQRVQTNKGSIKTKAIVNCAGVWAPAVGALCGVRVPLVAMHHAYVVSDRIEGIQNMPNVRDHDSSIYMKLQGDALSLGGYEPNPIFCGTVAPDFSFGLYDLDWDVFALHIEGCVNRVPVLEKTGIKSTVCGPESFTADHKPLMGEDPGLRGFYHNCGFNSGGMMSSGGWGREMARWIVHGRPEIDMFSYDIRRFNQDWQVGDERWCREKSHEAYAKNYSIVFPHDQPLAARNLVKDSIHEDLIKAGCVFEEKQGWERPGWFREDNANAQPLVYDYYGSYDYIKNKPDLYAECLHSDYTFDFPKHHDQIGAECLGCRERAALFNMSYFGQLYITGPDAQTAVDWIFSNNLSVGAGRTVYTCMLNMHGGVESDLTVSVYDDSSRLPHEPACDGEVGFYVACSGASSQHVRSHIEHELGSRGLKCKLTDKSRDAGLLSLQGPKSRAILSKLTGVSLDNDAFPFASHQVIEIGGEPVRAVRLTFVGEMGWELHTGMTSLPAVYGAIMAAGEDVGIVNAGYRAIESLSAEKGYRHWHADVRPDDSPLEAGLGFTCRKTGSYQGSDVIERQRASGVDKKLVCITLDEPRPLFGLEAIWRNNEVVGYLRRADYAFVLKQSIGYGYVRKPDEGVVDKAWLQSGEYELEIMGKRYKAQAHLNSPFDPKGRRIKGLY